MVLAEIPELAHPSGEAVVSAPQGVVPGRSDDACVDRLVETEIARQFTTHVVAVHFVVEALDLGNLRVRNPRACKPASGGFHCGQQLEELAHVLRRELTDASAPVGEQFDESLGREDFQGFAERCARHPELHTKLSLWNACSRP